MDIPVKDFPPFKPIAYFGGNLLLGGLSYVILRQYVRFFIFLPVLLLLSFLPFGGFAVLLGSAFDVYFIAKKLKSKELPEPRYNGLLTGIAIAIWAASIIYNIYTLYLITQLGGMG